MTPWGKKATIARSSRASEPSSLNIGDLSNSSMVAESVFLCCVCNRLVRRPSRSLVSRLTPQLFWYATVANRVIDSGWNSSYSRMLSTEIDCSPFLQIQLKVRRAASIDNVRIPKVSQLGEWWRCGRYCRGRCCHLGRAPLRRVYLARLRPLRIDYRFGIVEDY